MDADASDHAGTFDHGHVFARFGRSDGALLARRAAADYNEVVFRNDWLAYWLARIC
jgi:hypothetical protein